MQFAQALAHYHKALALQPSHKAAVQGLATLDATLQREPKAQELAHTVAAVGLPSVPGVPVEMLAPQPQASASDPPARPRARRVARPQTSGTEALNGGASAPFTVASE